MAPLCAPSLCAVDTHTGIDQHGMRDPFDDFAPFGEERLVKRIPGTATGSIRSRLCVAACVGVLVGWSQDCRAGCRHPSLSADAILRRLSEQPIPVTDTKVDGKAASRSTHANTSADAHQITSATNARAKTGAALIPLPCENKRPSTKSLAQAQHAVALPAVLYRPGRSGRVSTVRAPSHASHWAEVLVPPPRRLTSFAFGKATSIVGTRS